VDTQRMLGRFWVLAALCVIVCCWPACDDGNGPTDPEPTEADWLIYYSYDADSFNYYMPIYSTSELQAIDTIPLPPPTYHDLRFTTDGRYIVFDVATTALEIFVLDHSTGDTVGSVVTNRGGSLRISPNDEYVMSVGVNGLAVYSIPSLALVYTNATQISDGVFLPSSDRIVYSVDASDSLYAVDYINLPDSVATTPILMGPGIPSTFRPKYLAPDYHNALLYTVGVDAIGSPGLWVFDITDFSTVQAIPLPDDLQYGRPEMSASGGLGFLKGIGDTDDDNVILRYDPSARSLTRFLEGSNVVWPWFRPRSMALTPDNGLLAIVVSISGADSGALVLVDTEDGHIVTVFDHTFGQGRYARVYPVPR